MSSPLITFTVFYEHGDEIHQINCVGQIWSREDTLFCEQNPNAWLYLPSASGTVSIPVRRIVTVHEYV